MKPTSHVWVSFPLSLSINQFGCLVKHTKEPVLFLLWCDRTSPPAPSCCPLLETSSVWLLGSKARFRLQVLSIFSTYVNTRVQLPPGYEPCLRHSSPFPGSLGPVITDAKKEENALMLSVALTAEALCLQSEMALQTVLSSSSRSRVANSQTVVHHRLHWGRCQAKR